MDRIYLDNGASAPLDPKILELAKKELLENFGNPSSLHTPGLEAKRAMEEARIKVADYINAENEKTIIFTSGATESNNIAIRGAALRNKRKGQKVITSAIEHISVMNPMKELQKQGYALEIIPVDVTGLLDMDALREKTSEDTVLVSIMYANNEIGTVQPIKEIAETVHSKGAFLHVDAVAAETYIPIDVQADGIDLLTLSSSDLYGPKGAGALYIKPGIKVQTVMPGGGQERGLRSGTENTFAISGMGYAVDIAKKERDKEVKRLMAMRDRLIKEVLEKVEDSHLTGHPEKRLPNHASFRFDYIEGESILLNMDMYGIQIGTGSACSTKTLEASHVLLAIGLKHEQAHGSMVLTLGRFNKEEEIKPVIEAITETVKRLRDLSPLDKDFKYTVKDDHDHEHDHCDV